jgi:hypothetical protein
MSINTNTSEGLIITPDQESSFFDDINIPNIEISDYSNPVIEVTNESSGIDIDIEGALRGPSKNDQKAQKAQKDQKDQKDQQWFTEPKQQQPRNNYQPRNQQSVEVPQSPNNSDSGNNLDYGFIYNKEKIKKEPKEDDVFSVGSHSGSETSELLPSNYQKDSRSSGPPSNSFRQKEEHRSRETREFDVKPQRQEQYQQQQYQEPDQSYQRSYEEEEKVFNEPIFNSEDEGKMYYLIQLKGLENKGVVLNKKYSLASSFNDLKTEYRTHKEFMEKEASVQFMKNGLVTLLSGLEFLTKMYGDYLPMKPKLDGWSSSVADDIGSYEGIFERLYHKYRGTGRMEPELELILAVVGSAVMFHFTKTLFNTAIPNLGPVIAENPDLMSGIARAMDMAFQRTQQQGPVAPQGPPQQYQRAPEPMPMQAPVGINVESLLKGMGLSPGNAAPVSRSPPAGSFEAAMNNFPDRPTASRPFIDKKEVFPGNAARHLGGGEDDTVSVGSATSNNSEMRTISIGNKKTKKGGRGGKVISLV